MKYNLIKKALIYCGLLLGHNVYAMVPQPVINADTLMQRIENLTLLPSGLISDLNLIHDLRTFAGVQVFLLNNGLNYAQPGKTAAQVGKYLELVNLYLATQGEGGDLEFWTPHQMTTYTLLRTFLNKIAGLKKAEEQGT